MADTKTYPPDMKPWKLEPHYSRHVAAMTSEGLHSKAAIAEQLAWRDQQIETLRARVAELEQAHAEQVAEREHLQLGARLLVDCQEFMMGYPSDILIQWLEAEAERARQAKGDKRGPAEAAD